jgi:hypothetical protein
MKVNAWEELAEWLNREGMECYAELIWGAPGETVESFLAGYDRLANYATRVAAYPLLLLPNTEYSKNKAKYGLVTVRGNKDDFEYVLSHNTMTPQDNQLIHRFLFWSRLTAENPMLRSVWTALRLLGGITQSTAVMSMVKWFSNTDEPSARPLQELLARSFTDPDALGAARGRRDPGGDGVHVLNRAGCTSSGFRRGAPAGSAPGRRTTSSGPRTGTARPAC